MQANPAALGHLRKSEYFVETVSLTLCRAMVAQLHYARGSSNTAIFRHGLFHRDRPERCLGVAQWIPPAKGAAIATFDGDWKQVISLSRLAIRPEVPTNGASFLIGRSIRLIKHDGRFRCLVTYADTWQGHDGAIYRATNWEYLGLTGSELTFISESGALVARKSGPHTRTRGEMAELNHVEAGRHPKHKFRMILPEPRQRHPHGQNILPLMDVSA